MLTSVELWLIQELTHLTHTDTHTQQSAAQRNLCVKLSAGQSGRSFHSSRYKVRFPESPGFSECFPTWKRGVEL